MCSPTENMLLTIAALFTIVSARTITDTYTQSRAKLIQEEITASLGGKIQLTRDEIKANKILMRYKHNELDVGFNQPHLFNLSRNFLTYRDDVNKSKVYQIIRMMPKGALLHVHSTLLLGADLLRFTYEDHLYACYEETDLKLHFSECKPQQPCSGNWTLLSDMRDQVDDITSFDRELMKHFTLHSDDIKLLDADINTVWKRFYKICDTIKYLITYRPVREKFIYQSLKKLYEDNVMYVEFRTGLSNLYELNGTVHDKDYMVKLHQKITDQFKKQHPDFVGVKLILTKRRNAKIDEIRKMFQLTLQIKEKVPGIVAGIDFVGQEDKGNPLKEFLPALLEMKDEIDFYFHGGETNWFGTTTDENLVDAILLESKRIGHAFALIKHPHLMMAVAKRDIGLEVNVLSNSVLSLVRDVRNHPLATFLALNMPVILSSDDPGVWGADPLSHDFYVAFFGVASRHADLRMLKQLALNSIKYSALDDKEKVKLLNVFNRRWNNFMKNVILKHNNCLVLDSSDTD